MNTIKLAHTTKRFIVPNAQVGIENAQMFRHMIDDTCVSQEVPQDVLTGHINDMRCDFLSGEYCYRFIYGNTTYVFDLYDL